MTQAPVLTVSVRPFVPTQHDANPTRVSMFQGIERHLRQERAGQWLEWCGGESGYERGYVNAECEAHPLGKAHAEVPTAAAQLPKCRGPRNHGATF